MIEVSYNIGEMCYYQNMRETLIQPGFKRIFRFYAWLRFASLLVIPLILAHPRFKVSVSSQDILYKAIIIFADIVILLIYLYSQKLESLLGQRKYYTIGLAIATIQLLVEGHLLSIFPSFWSPLPFLYILLILIAWQYSFKIVVYYTIGVTLVELVLIFTLPGTHTIPDQYASVENILSIGFMVNRAVTFLILGYVITILLDAQKKQSRILKEANRKLIHHAETLELLATTRERNRISRELHDTLAHTLSALAVQLEAITTIWDPIPEKARQILAQMRTTTRTGLDETRRVLRDLRVSTLEEMGLPLALESLAQDFASRNGLKLEINISDNIERLSPDIEQVYYRVAQEALTNIAKHAKATTLRVILEKKDRYLVLEICDNGKGFTMDIINPPQGLGLQGMRERAELIGATLNITGAPSTGTTVTLELEQDNDTRINM